MVIKIDAKNTVLCDFCNKDYTNLPDEGGLLYEGYAACPKCEKDIIKKTVVNEETHLITCHCPGFMSFAHWVREELR